MRALNGLKGQSGLLSFAADKAILEKETTCAMVEFNSTTITRVVKSTMAAESASLSIALDRNLYLRLLLEAMIYGEPEMGSEWKHNLKIKGVLVTDARSLFDHLSTTGSVPKEWQTLIDLLVARDLVDGGAMILKWVPTWHMLADTLTKKMKPTPVLEKFLYHEKYSLKQTAAEEEVEARRKSLRQGQRTRRKERRDEEKKANCEE